MMKTGSDQRSLRIGFVSTRFAGTDGVSLETAKWAEVLERMGHTCFYFAGQSDRPAERTRVVPAAFFGHEAINAISKGAFEDEQSAAEDGWLSGDRKRGPVRHLSSICQPALPFPGHDRPDPRVCGAILKRRFARSSSSLTSICWSWRMPSPSP